MLRFLGITEPYDMEDNDCWSSHNPNTPYSGYDLECNGNATSISSYHEDALHPCKQWTEEDNDHWVEIRKHAQLEG